MILFTLGLFLRKNLTKVVESYKKMFVDYLKEKQTDKKPKNLYEPIDYILNLGGKKLRPILVLLGLDAFGGDVSKGLPAAAAVEVFHNFTLVHDDIMDDAPLRRGEETVHEKWDINTGILSGDAMLILSYQFLEGYDSKLYKELMTLLMKTSLEVCEGQQLDVDFETRTDVQIEEYIKMISLKTSVLVACALKMGALIANSSSEDANKIYEFGLNLGLAFQLQDDYLDAFGDPETFGKQVGGDIIENKKTYLYLKTLNEMKDKSRLLELFSDSKKGDLSKVDEVKLLFIKYGADVSIKELIKVYTNKAFYVLEEINISQDKKDVIIAFGQGLMNRNV